MGYIDQAGQLVDETPVKPNFPPFKAAAGDSLSIANYGPDVQGGQPIATQSNAVVDPSLMQVRQPSPPTINYGPQVANGAQMGPPDDTRSVAVPPQGRGILSTAVAAQPTGPIAGYQPESTVAGAQLRQMQANEAANLQASQAQGSFANRAAQSSYDLSNAQQAARVSRFRATDGADMVLAPENAGYDLQRKAIVDAAKADADTVAGLRTQTTALDTAAAGGRDYINDFARGENALSINQEANQRGGERAVDTELKRGALAGQKQLQALRDQLSAAKDPKLIKELQGKILAIEGKSPHSNRYSVIDIDTGQFETDVMGNKKPIFKRGVFDHDAGQIIGDRAGGGAAPTRTPSAASIELAKKDPKMRAEFLSEYGKDAEKYLK